MEPYVALMRRYCIDYTCAHNPSICDEIMSSSYEITISGRTMGMADYRQAVAAAFRRYPTLMLTVHDMITSGDRLAMHFSEHGAAAADPDHVAVWSGISLYRWDGQRLLNCRVEQDFLGRDEQSESSHIAPLEPAHPDPWSTTRDTPANARAEQAVRAWFDLATTDWQQAVALPGVRFLEYGVDTPLPLVNQEVVIDDLFSAGDRVAAAVTFRGEYTGGLPGVSDDARGRHGELPATALARVDGDNVVERKLVRDRWGLIRRLRKAA